METGVNLGTASATLLCFFLALSYVVGIYLSHINKISVSYRDRPDVIKKRAIGVLLACLINVFIIRMFHEKTPSAPDLHLLFGFRLPGLLLALIVPLLLTMILFLGPLATNHFYGLNHDVVFNHGFWKSILLDWIAIRNFIIAPISEELCFRAFMLPILIPNFGIWYSVFISPLFFGLAHFHHLYEKIALHGMDISRAVASTAFQFMYTTLFGIYSAFLFLRTGHIVSAILAHSFCNYMGFPDFYPLTHSQGKQKIILISCFVGGLVLWMILLFPLTNPTIYSNDIYAFV